MPSGSADAAVGMMDGAYFVGRKELLDFFNTLLDVEYTKIEQTAPGAMACQVTSLIFPGSIPMSRVNWMAKADFEFVQNYKLLQSAFTKHAVQRHVDVDKLIRAKYQDNLEFCQWLKAFFEQAGASRPDNYDPAAVRNKGKGGKAFNEKFGRNHATSRRIVTGRTTTNTNMAPPVVAKKPSTMTTTLTTRPSRPLRDRDDNHKDNVNNNNNNNDTQMAAEMQALQTKNQELTTRVAELEESLLALEEERDAAIVEVEKERDFYFTKLRDVEVLLQIHQESWAENMAPHAVFDELFKVLYATAEEQVQVTEHGTVITKTEAATAALEGSYENDLEEP